ncbi:MAG: hypothetical protein L6R28_24640 [Planctomycetes bacterium]|nr:hypothetical protein [Planctomycetota bacterium]
MRTKAQMLEIVEDRCLNWSWDCKVPVLSMALSMIDELPRDMKDQALILNAMLLKAEYYGRLREALYGLTTQNRVLRLEAPNHPWTLTAPANPGSEGQGIAQAVGRILDEANRLEKEFANVKIDYDAIYRFLRKALKD